VSLNYGHLLHEEQDVEERLAALGLSIPLLREAVEQGEAERNRSTPNDPPCAPGTYAWIGTTRALRERLTPAGWERNDDGNLSTVISPDKKMSISVVSGDMSTGIRGASPKTKHRRGSMSIYAISSNAKQLPLFPEDHQVMNEGRLHWLLLICKDGDTLRYELSLPSAVNSGQVTEWNERIILPPIDFSDLGSLIPIDQGPEVEVKIQRRQP
jgi:hypothetical protein